MDITMQQSLESYAFMQDVQTRGYSELKHGIDSEEIEALIAAYTDFTVNLPDPEPSTMGGMLPEIPDDLTDLKQAGEWIAGQLDSLDRTKDTQKGWHKYRTNTPAIGKPEGYTNRSFQEHALAKSRNLIIPPEDPKELYHFSPRHYVSMIEQHDTHNWGKFPTEVTRLESAFRPIHRKATELVLKVVGLIEESKPQIGKVFTKNSLFTSPVRLLFYHPDGSDQLGGGHYDKSGLTIQIAESHQGLRVAKDKYSTLQTIERSPDVSPVFTGLGMKKHLGDTLITPAWHDIIRINKVNQGRFIPPTAEKVCARWALIFFANGSKFINPERSQTHKR